jgi:hypothetical protein
LGKDPMKDFAILGAGYLTGGGCGVWIAGWFG